MAKSIPDTIFKAFFDLNQKVQKIEGKVAGETVTPKKRVELHHHLETLQLKMEKLKQKAALIHQQSKYLFAQFEEIENQIISLYRKIEENFEEHEVCLIWENTVDLVQSLSKGKMTEIAKKINELKQNIHYLFAHRQPSLAHRKIVSLALRITNQAEEILHQSKALPVGSQLQSILFLKALLDQILGKRKIEIDLAEAELAMELFEIADLFSQKKETEARLRLNLIYHQLTEGQKKKIMRNEFQPKKIAKLLVQFAEGDTGEDWEEKETHIFHFQSPLASAMI